jgi:hypothetical protein
MQSWVSCKSSILYDVEFGLCLCESVVVFHLLRCDLAVWGSMLWFEQRLEWWRWLIPSWHVVLESAKDQILGVETPWQLVPPHVRYGTDCLLIRNDIGCLSCLVEWGWASFFVPYFVTYFVTYFVIYLNHMQVEPLWESATKHDILLQLTFVMVCSDLCAIHHWKCQNSKKEVYLVA